MKLARNIKKSLIDSGLNAVIIIMENNSPDNLLPYMDEVDTGSVRYNILCGEALFPNVIIDWHKSNPNMVTYNM